MHTKQNRIHAAFAGFAAALLLLVAFLFFSPSSAAAAQETVNMYTHDGRYAQVPQSEAAAWRDVGWLDYFPYAGKTFWVSDLFFMTGCTDIYGNDTINILPWPKKYTEITVTWYDDQDWVPGPGIERVLRKVIFTIDGAEYKMSIADLLRGGPEGMYPQIFWTSPKQLYNLSDQKWQNVLNHLFWVGMTKEEFLLVEGGYPSRTYTDELGREVWVYYDTLYYFDKGRLLNRYDA